MRKSLFIIATMLLLCAATTFAAVINISNCSLNLSNSGNIYMLTNSTNITTGSNCLNITAANITLDCAGFTIDDTGVGTGTGISIAAVNNVTVRNCYIVGFDVSILPQADDMLIENNTLMNASTAGISTIGMSDSTIANNTIFNITGAASDSFGILLTAGSNNNTILNNTIRNNTAPGGNTNFGLRFQTTSTANKVYWNTFLYSEFGIHDIVGGNNLSGNRITNHTAAAIFFNGSNNGWIVDNTLLYNGNDGMFIYNSSNNVITGNNASNNTRYGIKLLVGSTGNNLTGNTVSGNAIGIYAIGAPSNNIINATADKNTNASYVIANSVANTLTGSSGSLSLNGLLLINGTNTTVSECAFDNSTQADVFLNSTGCSLSNIYLDYYYDANFTTNTYHGTFNISGTDYTNTTLLYNATVKNLTQFVNITNTTPGAWMVLNMSYKPRNAFNIMEATIKMYHWNTTNWTNITGSTIDVTNNVVSANLTSFSAFGPLGDTTACGWINTSTTLTADLYSAGRCLRIGANNVVLNCNNHGLWGRLVSQGINITNKVNVTIRNCLVYNFSSGILGDNVTNSTFINNTANINTVGYNFTTVNTSNFTASLGRTNGRGLALMGYCLNNSFENLTFTANTVNGIFINNESSTFNTFRDIYVNNSGITDLCLLTVNTTSNAYYDITIGTTTFSFNQYLGNANISGVPNPAAAPTGKTSINKFLNVSKITGNWIVLNFSYRTADVAAVVPTTLEMYHYNGSLWTAVPRDSVFTQKQVVTANITTFSDFGLFGDAKTPVRQGGGGSSSGSGASISPATTEEKVAPPTVTYPPTSPPAQDNMQQDTNTKDVYVPKNDMLDTRASSTGAKTTEGMSTASIIGLIVAIIAIGVFVAFLAHPKSGRKRRK
ncbi:right-handed parallel beta-helix repeat-containing protein [Candidatus Woesearchaeota archaeon]|nr:right-handed parallel beta-helix repeat-containing protein [Candidatus Woesearchaeota archaeon]